jgi:tagatose-1,6-bisphosphate aldolase non-catalytic subunit AgaZ/GatZ
VAAGTIDPAPRSLALEAIGDVLAGYAAACGTAGSA